MELWIIFIVFVLIYWELRYYLTKPKDKPKQSNESKSDYSESPIVQNKPDKIKPKPKSKSHKAPTFDYLGQYKHQQYKFISASDKIEYMKSAKWKLLKEQRLTIADNKCEYCGSKHNLHLHHETYERLTVEEIEDLKILCSVCHTKIHNLLGYDRTTEYPISILKNY